MEIKARKTHCTMWRVRCFVWIVINREFLGRLGKKVSGRNPKKQGESKWFWITYISSSCFVFILKYIFTTCRILNIYSFSSKEERVWQFTPELFWIYQQSFELLFPYMKYTICIWTSSRLPFCLYIFISDLLRSQPQWLWYLVKVKSAAVS